MKKLIFLGFVFFVLTGCATTSMTAPNRLPDISPRQDKATLVIIRDAFIGSPIVFWNYIDKKLIGETKGKTFFVAHVSPGPHYLIATSENSVAYKINFKPGRTYYLNQGVAMGIWRARVSGYGLLSADQAKKAMKECTYLELNPENNTGDLDPKRYKEIIAEYEKEIKENYAGFKNVLEYQGD